MREEKRFEIVVHVAPLTYRKVGEAIEILIAKRGAHREFYPNKWECGGGQVLPKENFEEAAERQQREEFKINIGVIAPIAVYEIHAPNLAQKKVPGINFVCQWLAGEPGISEEHIEYKWLPIKQLDGIDFIPGVGETIQRGAELFRSSSK